MALLNIALVIFIGTRPGAPGDNRYGPPPGRVKDQIVDTFS